MIKYGSFSEAAYECNISQSAISQQIQALKNIPCILVSPETEQGTEAEYYNTIVRLKGEKLFADNMEQARTFVISGKGFLPE